MSHTENFAQLYQRACDRKGGEKELNRLLSQPLNDAELKKVPEDRYLSAFTKKIFQSGFVWRVVENKWADFEKVFFEFDIQKILLMPDEMLEKKAQNPAIIRNYRKVKTVRDNAMMIADVQQREGSFAKFVGQWASEDIVGLWNYLKKHGSRLGGNTGPYALRVLGKDTFILSRDVEQYLLKRDVFHGSATSKRSLTQIQAFFNELQQQSGRTMQELSQIIAFSVGDNLLLAEQ